MESVRGGTGGGGLKVEEDELVRLGLGGIAGLEEADGEAKEV